MRCSFALIRAAPDVAGPGGPWSPASTVTARSRADIGRGRARVAAAASCVNPPLLPCVPWLMEPRRPPTWIGSLRRRCDEAVQDQCLPDVRLWDCRLGVRWVRRGRSLPDVRRRPPTSATTGSWGLSLAASTNGCRTSGCSRIPAYRRPGTRATGGLPRRGWGSRRRSF